MKLPRDISGDMLTARLAKYGYKAVRQTGSHMRLSSTHKGFEHCITIPRHKSIKVGTLGSILDDIASYLEVDKAGLVRELFD
jgi:predicted RNA binding protein YcfA (HicA-like mRNA interferase family)